MSFNIVSIGSNAGTSTSTLSVSVPVGGVPARSMIVVCISDSTGSGAVGSVVDSTSNNYIQKVIGTNGGVTANGYGAIFISSTGNALVSGNLITFTLGAAGNNAAIGAFYVAGALSIDGFSSITATGSSAAPSVTSNAPAAPGELFIAMVSSGSAANGFSQDNTNAVWGSPIGAVSTGPITLGGGNVVNPSPGALTYAPTFATSVAWAALIMSLLPVPSTATPFGIIGAFDTEW